MTTLVPWFGSNRTLADRVGAALAGCRWVGVPFAGGMSELLHIDAPSILVGDLHRHVVNLARVAADPDLRPRLVERLDATAFHPDELAAAQERCRERERPQVATAGGATSWAAVAAMAGACDLDWAADYFAAAWMSRNGSAGTDREFEASYSARWTATGGDSAVRFRRATEALAEWQRVMRRCTFVVMDAFEFLERVEDRDGHAVYADPPFPDAGQRYRHSFDEAAHRRLAARLGGFAACRVVARFYDHPLVRELYPEPAWRWSHAAGRRQSNTPGPEVLLVKEHGR